MAGFKAEVFFNTFDAADSMEIQKVELTTFNSSQEAFGGHTSTCCNNRQGRSGKHLFSKIDLKIVAAFGGEIGVFWNIFLCIFAVRFRVFLFNLPNASDQAEQRP